MNINIDINLDFIFVLIPVCAKANGQKYLKNVIMPDVHKIKNKIINQSFKSEIQHTVNKCSAKSV